MSSQLGPVEVCCDAPPYRIVRECRGIGIRSPEDVRWLRMATFRARPAGRPYWFSFVLRKLLGRASEPTGRTCTCGEPLPDLGLLTITFETGGKLAYLIGQCVRCQTVFWDNL